MPTNRRPGPNDFVYTGAVSGSFISTNVSAPITNPPEGSYGWLSGSSRNLSTLSMIERRIFGVIRSISGLRRRMDGGTASSYDRVLDPLEPMEDWALRVIQMEASTREVAESYTLQNFLKFIVYRNAASLAGNFIPFHFDRTCDEEITRLRHVLSNSEWDFLHVSTEIFFSTATFGSLEEAEMLERAAISHAVSRAQNHINGNLQMSAGRLTPEESDEQFYCRLITIIQNANEEDDESEVEEVEDEFGGDTFESLRVPQAPPIPRAAFSRFITTEELPLDEMPDEFTGDEMATVGELFGRNPDPSSVTSHPLIVGTGRVGVELEVEDCTNYPNRMRYWSTHQDGSLRNNGIEFVFSSPLGGADAFAAIAELDSVLFRNQPDLNLRCSTHVHVDVRDMTVDQVKRMILAYTYFEGFLFRLSGYYRMKSNFCMPFAKAEGMVEILARHWNHRSGDSFLRYAQQNWDKYCSMNLIPMGNYGSIEFRMSEAKSRKGQLIRLVNRFLALKELAKSTELKDVEFISHIASLDVRQVFRKGLPAKGMEIFDEDFKMGSMLAHDICCRGKIRN